MSESYIMEAIRRAMGCAIPEDRINLACAAYRPANWPLLKSEPIQFACEGCRGIPLNPGVYRHVQYRGAVGNEMQRSVNVSACVSDDPYE